MNGDSVPKRLRPLRETEAEDQLRQNRGAGQSILRAFLFALEAMLYFGYIHILDGKLPTYYVFQRNRQN